MVVQVNGKEHRKGTSKKGQAYDFFVLHFLAPSRGVEGKAAIQKLVDPSLLSYEQILVGQYYDLEIGLSGEIVRILPSKS